MEWLAGGLVEASDRLYLMLNGLSGQSRLFDAAVSLIVDNNLVKAAPLAAAFVFAWYHGEGTARLRARRVLIATLASLLLVLGAAKAISGGIFLPRPFALSQQTWHLEGDELVRAERLPYSVPNEGFSGGRYDRLRAGEIEENDLASFPSDHAAFYFALALGLFFANRRAGAFALAWTVVAICGSRIVTGAHSPLDIAAGIAIGAAGVGALQWLVARFARAPADAVAGWTLRWPGMSAALLFLAMFEVANTLETSRDAARVVKRMTGL